MIKGRLFAPFSLEFARKTLGKPIQSFYANGMTPNHPGKDDPFKDMLGGERYVLKDQLVVGCIDDHNIVENFFTEHFDMPLIVGELYFIPFEHDNELKYLQISDPFQSGNFKGIRCLSENSCNGENYIVLGGPKSNLKELPFS